MHFANHRKLIAASSFDRNRDLWNGALILGLQAHRDHPLNFARQVTGGVNLADERKSEGSVRKHQHGTLQALIAPDQDFELIAGIDPIWRRDCGWTALLCLRDRTGPQAKER
jgi:hypothetical protein